jgi:hypothetical protein
MPLDARVSPRNFHVDTVVDGQKGKGTSFTGLLSQRVLILSIKR